MTYPSDSSEMPERGRRGDFNNPKESATEQNAESVTGAPFDKSEDRKPRHRWKMAASAAALATIIVLILWPKAKEKEAVMNPLPHRTVSKEPPSYLKSYQAGLDHMRRKEYGQAVLDFEDALNAKANFYSARQKLEEARALGELDAMVKRNLLSAEAAAIKSPVLYSGAAGRKAYELEGISFLKAAEDRSIGSKVAWRGIVVGENDGSFTVENPKLREVFVVRSNVAPEIGATVEVYGKIAGIAPSVPGAKSPFPVPIVDADIVDSTAFR